MHADPLALNDKTPIWTKLVVAGVAVDWFLMIKFPRSTSYAYMDSNAGSKFVNSTYHVSDKTVGALSQTLVPTFSSGSFVLYNDEPVNGMRFVGLLDL